MSQLSGKRVLITGGTGSLGKVITKRLLASECGGPQKVTIFSRDEAKQHFMRLEYLHRFVATDEVIYQNVQNKLAFKIGDIRDLASVTDALRDVDIVINAAAMKQVPTCEYFPSEAVSTNITGAENIVKAIRQYRMPVETVVGVSTDKACKPINVMGMTKAIQEKIFVQANLMCPQTRFICTRYGNVLASRGSVIPLFLEQIRKGGPVTITVPEMTRFLLSLEDACTLIFDAIDQASRGETWVPHMPSSLVTNIAKALIGDKSIPIVFTGIRPGEKIHEILISEEEVSRVHERGQHYSISSVLPELISIPKKGPVRSTEYSSLENILSLSATAQLLAEQRLMPEDQVLLDTELLR
jgi:FlaA1/EpsC-like NDP-sugar epimerase